MSCCADEYLPPSPPLSKQTAAYKIFHYPYMWFYPENVNFDINDTEYFGRVSSGDAKFDEVMANTMSDNTKTIADAAAIAATGAPIGLTVPKHALEVYKIICEHLDDWYNHLSKSKGLFGRRGNVPLEGLRELNALAKMVAELGKCHGLIDTVDKQKRNRDLRSISIYPGQEINARDITHSDATYHAIVAMVKNDASNRLRR